MKGFRWICFVAGRYVSRGRRNSPSSVFSVLGIATGVLALTVIIAVMNGFQMGFIESILEISSYHVRIEGLPADNERELIDNIRSLPGIISVLPFRELNVLLRGKQGSPRGALIRGVPVDALNLDPGLAAKLEMENGTFDISDSPLPQADSPVPQTGSPASFNIILGAELASHLSVRVGDQVTLLSVSGGIADDEEGGSRLYTVAGTFRSGFYEYDLGWGFVSLDAAGIIDSASGAGTAAAPILGIKLKNRFSDQKAIGEIRDLLARSGLHEESGGLTITSWRDYNRAFFGALRTEKLMMFILVGLIFIVVGLNIFQAQRRTVLERREEIGLLRALGASDTAVRLVFVWDGFIIGLTGAGLGLGLGLLIAYHIPAFFSFLEGAVNFLISIVNTLSSYLGGNAGAEEFAVFSPQIFYIKEIPSRVIFHEVVLIFLFGFLSALLAAWFASGKVSGTRPAEVLRYE